MGYDLQRAALVTCCLSALLLAASLMPAAGLGSFPSPEGPSGGDAVPDRDPPERPTPAETTPPESTVTTETPTPTPVDRTTETEETETTTEKPDDEDDSAIATIIGIVSTALTGVVAGLLLTGAYTVTVLAGGMVFGYEAVSWLPFSGTIKSVPQMTMSSLIGTAAVTGSFAGQLRSTLSAVGDGLSELARVPAEFGRVVSLAFVGPIRALGNISLNLGSFGALLSLPSGFGRRGSRETGSSTATDARDTGGPEPEASSDDPPPLPTSVMEAFDRMTDRLSAPYEHAKTPAEFAEYAIERGWPAGPVETLTSTFREIRYGGREETGEQTDRAVSAYEQLREFWRGSK